MSFSIASSTSSLLDSPARLHPNATTNFSASAWILSLFHQETYPNSSESLDEFLSQLSPTHRNDLQQRFGSEALAELRSLSQENDPQLFFEAMLSFARRCELQNRSDLALATYQLLREGTGHPEVERRAASGVSAIQGGGATGPRAEFLLRHLAGEATDPAMILSMGLAGAAFRLTRLGLLSRLATSPGAGALTRGLGARITANLGGFLVESTTFTLAGRGLNEALGRPQNWDLGALSRDWAAGSISLGSLKFFGWAGGRLYQRAAGVGHLSGVARPSFGLSLSQQGSMFAGILSAHGLEERLGLRARREGSSPLIEGLTTLLQFNVAGRLSHHAFGEAWRTWERGLDLQTQGLTRSLPRWSVDTGTPSMELASSVGPRLFSGRRGEVSNPLLGPWVVFMERQDELPGVNTVPEGDGTRPIGSSEIREAPESSVEAASESGDTISWLPKGAKQLEIALREFLNMHPHAAAVFELSPAEIGSGATGNVLMINQRLTTMFGYTEAEALGLSLHNFMHQRDFPFFRDLSKGLLETGTLDLPEVRYRRKDGSMLWCRTTGMIKRVNGRNLGFAFLEDITARREEQAALAASEVRNRALVQAIPDLIFRIRADMTFLDVHFPREDLFVLPPQALIGKRVHDLPLPEELRRFGVETMTLALQTGTFQRVEYELPMPDGSRRYQEARVSPSGEDEVVVIVRDTTELKRAEEHRIAAERLDAVKMMTRGFAHNIANRLAVLMPFQNFNRDTLRGLQQLFHELAEKPTNGRDPILSETFLQKLTDFHNSLFRNGRGNSMPEWNSPADVYRAFENIVSKALEDLHVGQENTELILAAVHSFRRLSAEPETGPPFELNSLVDRSELGNMLGTGTSLEIHLTPDTQLVPGPRGHVADILQNLVINARDAMAGRAARTLSIETALVHFGQDELSRLQSLSPGPLPLHSTTFMRLRVRDTGAGIDPSVRDRIFEPYFSTKPTSEVGASNRGLGLAMTFKHVQDAGGFLTVDSTPGEGTTFDVYLPALENPSSAPISEDLRSSLERRLQDYFRNYPPGTR